MRLESSQAFRAFSSMAGWMSVARRISLGPSPARGREANYSSSKTRATVPLMLAQVSCFSRRLIASPEELSESQKAKSALFPSYLGHFRVSQNHRFPGQNRCFKSLYL